MDTMKVLFHIDELNKWYMTVANVKNMINFSRKNEEKVKT